MTAVERIVVVGAGLAGLRAAERLRELGFAGELVIVGDERRKPYHRPALTKQLLSGELRPHHLALKPYVELDAVWRTNSPALRLDTSRHVVELAGDEELRYDGLVIATGVQPRHLPGTPRHSDRVHMLRTLSDAIAVQQNLRRGSGPVAVIGGGFTACEIASTVREMGREATIISRSKVLCNRVFGDDLGMRIMDLQRKHGVRLAMGAEVSQWMAQPQGLGMYLTTGQMIVAECVILAIGSVPAVQWLRGSGLTLEDGVLCRPTTHAVGASDVVAAGDVARWPNLRFEATPRRLEHWINAVEMGRHAAESLLAGPSAAQPFTPLPRFWTEMHGVRIQASGMPTLGDDMVKLAGRPGRRGVIGQVKDGRLIGVIGWDSPRGMLRWTAELDRELNRPRTAPQPAVPAAEPAVARPAPAPTRRAAPVAPAPQREFAPVGPPPREVAREMARANRSGYRPPVPPPGSDAPETDAIRTPRGRITSTGYHSGPIPRITDSGPGRASGYREPVGPAASGYREPVGPANSGYREPVGRNSGYREPVGPAASGYREPVGPAASGYREPVGPAASGYREPVGPAASGREPVGPAISGYREPVRRNPGNRDQIRAAESGYREALDAAFREQIGSGYREPVGRDSGRGLESGFREPVRPDPETDAIQTPYGRITMSGYHSGPIPRVVDSGYRKPVAEPRRASAERESATDRVPRSARSGYYLPVPPPLPPVVPPPMPPLPPSSSGSSRRSGSSTRSNATPRPLPERPNATQRPTPERPVTQRSMPERQSSTPRPAPALAADRPPLPRRRRGDQNGPPLPPLEVSYPGTRIPRLGLAPVPLPSEHPSGPLPRVTDSGFTEPVPAPGFILTEGVPGPEPESRPVPPRRESLPGPLERYTNTGFASGPIPRISQDMLEQARREAAGHPSGPIPRVRDADSIDTPRGRITASGYHSGPIPRVGEDGHPAPVRRLSSARRARN